VNTVTDNTIMLNNCTRIDDTSCSDFRERIYNCIGKDNCSRLNFGKLADNSLGMNKRRKLYFII
jgi:hypothetical protein